MLAMVLDIRTRKPIESVDADGAPDEFERTRAWDHDRRYRQRVWFAYRRASGVDYEPADIERSDDHEVDEAEINGWANEVVAEMRAGKRLREAIAIANADDEEIANGSVAHVPEKTTSEKEDGAEEAEDTSGPRLVHGRSGGSDREVAAQGTARADAAASRRGSGSGGTASTPASTATTALVDQTSAGGPRGLGQPESLCPEGHLASPQSLPVSESDGHRPLSGAPQPYRNCGVSQGGAPVARRAHNAKEVGSTPTPATTSRQHEATTVSKATYATREGTRPKPRVTAGETAHPRAGMQPTPKRMRVPSTPSVREFESPGGDQISKEPFQMPPPKKSKKADEPSMLKPPSIRPSPTTDFATQLRDRRKYHEAAIARIDELLKLEGET